eukprot:2158109-Prymnesium_polylepis.1
MDETVHAPGAPAHLQARTCQPVRIQHGRCTMRPQGPAHRCAVRYSEARRRLAAHFARCAHGRPVLSLPALDDVCELLWRGFPWPRGRAPAIKVGTWREKPRRFITARGERDAEKRRSLQESRRSREVA